MPIQHPPNEDLQQWMSLLPDRIAAQRLNALAIPGSHNSFTSRLTNRSKASPDGDLYNWIRFLPDFMASSLLYPWTVTQHLDMVEQLHAGIRYFDLRVAVQCTEHQPCDFILVHGQYGTRLIDELKLIVQFLRTHPKEVVLIDCNHCYGFETDQHVMDFETSIFQVLSPMLYPRSPSIPTLKDVWASGKQVLFFSRVMSAQNEDFWPTNRMVSLWPNTASPSEMIAYLDDHYGPNFPRSPDKFYVFQGVLTATASYVWDHLDGSLRQLAKSAGQVFMTWLKNPVRRAGQDALNITLLDFVHTDFPEYATEVIHLNYVTWSPNTG